MSTAKDFNQCAGCSQNFCYNHIVEHRQQLSAQLDQIEQDRFLFQQTLDLHRANSQKSLLFQQVDRWEQESIDKIKQTAQEIRQLLSSHTNENTIKTELNELTQQIRHSRDEEDFNEEDLHKWKEQLKQLTQQLNTPPNIVVQQIEIPLINKIQIESSNKYIQSLTSIPIISINAKWMQNGITVVGGNGHENSINEPYNPVSVFVDDEENIYAADLANHRIVQWRQDATTGQVVAGGQGEGDRNDQLKCPTNVLVDKKNDCLIICDDGNNRVVRWPRRNGASGETIICNITCYGAAIDNHGHLYIPDYGRQEVRRWKRGNKDGTLVAGGNGRGSRLDQLNQPYYIFVDQDQSVYVSDHDNHRVVKWVKGAREGVVVAGGQGEGDALNQLSSPRGIVADQFGTVYVADWCNHRVVRWLKGASEGSVIVGGNGIGAQGNQLNCPVGLSFDRQNNLYVADCDNYRIQKFNIESN